MGGGELSDHTRGESLPRMNFQSRGVVGRNSWSCTVAMPLDGGFCGSLEEIEGLGGFGGDGVRSLFEVVGDFYDGGGCDGESGDVFRDVGPVDTATAGPEVVVFGAVVVVKVELGDAGLEELECLVDTYVFFGVRQVCVAYVEADAYAVEVAGAEDFEDVLG